MKKSLELKSFIFKGINNKGNLVSDQIEAINIRFAKAQLEEQGIALIHICRNTSVFRYLQKRKKIKQADIYYFISQLSTLISTGIPILNAFQMIIQQTNKPKFSHLLTEIKILIQAGNALSSAMHQYPQYFNSLVCQLIYIGEKTGYLDSILLRIISYYEKRYKLIAKIKKALFYPIIITVTAIAMTILLLTFAVPQLAALFSNLGAPLPLPTQLVIKIGMFLKLSWPFLFSLSALMPFIIKKIRAHSSQTRRAFDRWILKLPIFGTIIQESIIASFAQTLSLTLKSGIPIIEALGLTHSTMSNILFREIIQQIIQTIQRGISLSTAFKNAKMFPIIVVQMVAIGEEAGKLDEMFEKISEHYMIEIDQKIEMLKQLLEPSIMLILGLLIGGLIIAMYLPLFKLGTVI